MNNEPVAWLLKENPQVEGEVIPLYTHPAKDLTDEEIAQEWSKFYPDVFHTHLIEFARAILRKASEK